MVGESGLLVASTSTFVAENEIFSDGFVRRRSVYRLAIQIPEWALMVSIPGVTQRHQFSLNMCSCTFLLFLFLCENVFMLCGI